MAKRKRRTTPQTTKNRLKQGRGLGRLADYQPWLHIQDVPSIGLACRTRGWKTNRVHHFLSRLELYYFYVLEWAKPVVDIREQFPLLPSNESLAIAANCDIAHPLNPQTKHPIVITTDFVITVRREYTDVDEPYTVKLKEDLCSRRTLDKLEIERRWWALKNKGLKIVTEDSIPMVLAKNVEWVHPYYRPEDFTDLDDLAFSLISSTVLLALRKEPLPLSHLTMQLDDRLGLEVGTCLSITRHLIANRHICVDMHKPINPSQPLNLIE